jgi:glutaredoxin 3
MAARALLEDKGVAFETIDIGEAPERRGEMLERSSGRSTVPQIFIGDTHVGGFDELSALERAGELDALLETVSNDNTTTSTNTESTSDD